ncbi:MAG: hypothetical protein GC150_12885 [Rhizobiales bacterium]|nr:hypothetical protein [Hyphomicrobiales bacterium]
MFHRLPIAAVSTALALGAVTPAAIAESIAISCEVRETATPSPMTLTYEGGANGTLAIAASFGEVSLPASREDAEVEVDGQKAKQTGIRAFGAARVLMPEKGALETCIAGKRTPGEVDDILGLLACQPTVALAPAEVTLSVEVLIGGAVAEPFVFLKRTYVESSEGYLDGSGQTGGRIAIETTSPPTCRLD